MDEQPRPLLGTFFIIGGPLTVYAYLKLTGQIPEPGWSPWNYVDTVVMKALHFLKYAVPVALVIASIIFSIVFRLRKKREKEEQEYREQLKREMEYERHLDEQRQIRVKAIESRFSKIEKELGRLNEELLQMKKSSSEVNNSVLQNFL
jgi:hypothetical protein